LEEQFSLNSLKSNIDFSFLKFTWSLFAGMLNYR
jgi:hypothetical protein